MPNPTLTDVLCLYAIHGDPIECKLAFLRNARDFQLPNKCLLELLFNTFSEKDDPAQFGTACDNLIEYICLLNINYYEELLRRGFPKASEAYKSFNDLENTPSSFQKAEQLAAITSQIDSYPGFISKADLNLDFVFIDNVPAHLAMPLRNAVVQSRSIHNNIYGPAHAYYMQARLKDFVGNPTHIVAEFMESISHIATACCLIARARRQSADNNTTSAIKKLQLAEGNFESVIRHLNRVSMDMLKIVNGLILTNDTLNIEGIKKVLALRHSCCPMKFGSEKLTAYLAVTNELFDTYVKPNLALIS
jgi:hypothetical protein